jgi:hypothetical protein
MLNQIENNNNQNADDVIEPYAFNLETALSIARSKQLKRFYPGVSPADIDSMSAESVHFTLDRTMHFMLHLDQTFSMDRNFDYDHFVKMKTQGEIYRAWLDSEDGTPWPSELKYTSSVVNELSDDDDANVEATEYALIDNNLVPVVASDQKIKKPRSPSSRSAYHQAKAIYQEDIAAGHARSKTLARFVSELGMKENTANVYYSKLKHA